MLLYEIRISKNVALTRRILKSFISGLSTFSLFYLERENYIFRFYSLFCPLNLKVAEQPNIAVVVVFLKHQRYVCLKTSDICLKKKKKRLLLVHT